jgi:acetyltransferase-like isoleucine patch superfamily enzyme
MIDRIINKFWQLKARKEGGEAFSYSLRNQYYKKYNIKIGYGTYGCFNHYTIPAGTEFGNYCSIGPGVRFFRANHPINYFTSHPLFYNPIMGYVKQDMLKRPKLTIGHDVWIGANTIITPRVMKVGNGSIIGAGSVVTKDVPPYTIVAGNPAKVIKTRFSEDIIEKLEDSKWWELNKEELINNRERLQAIVDGK